MSAKQPSALPITVVTGLTLSRLDALEGQCYSWGGPLVAAVYVVLRMGKGVEGIGATAVAAGGSSADGERRQMQRLMQEGDAELAEFSPEHRKTLAEAEKKLKELFLRCAHIFKCLTSYMPHGTSRSHVLVASSPELRTQQHHLFQDSLLR